ncbi:hypothetical protein D3C74_268740 [compost metagenome]
MFVPEETLEEYKIDKPSKVFIMSGSKTSKGFSILSNELLHKYNSHILRVIKKDQTLYNQEVDEYILRDKGRIFSWVFLDNDNYISLSPKQIKEFQIQPEGYLLSIRSSNVAFVNIEVGPIVERAKKATNIQIFE